MNNNEMGILIQRSEDGQLYEEAQRISDEVRISLESVSSNTTPDAPAAEPDKAGKTDVAHMADRPDNRAAEAETATAAATGEKLSSSKIAAKLSLKTAQLLDRATEHGFLALDGDRHVLTAKGDKAGAEFVVRSRFGPYFLWPQDFHPV